VAGGFAPNLAALQTGHRFWRVAFTGNFILILKPSAADRVRSQLCAEQATRGYFAQTGTYFGAAFGKDL
jgi:hypothetical protein